MSVKKAMAKSVQQWHPDKYLAFEAHRLRPARELLDRAFPTGSNDPVTIVDLGAGTGNMAAFFVERFPNAQVEFVDTSESMLAKAKQQHQEQIPAGSHRFVYVQRGFETYSPPGDTKVNMIFSNAALHWVDAEHHKSLMPKLFSFLKPGGKLMFQIPDSRLQSSHLLMREAAKQLGMMTQIESIRTVSCERDPGFYYELFQTTGVCQDLDMWATEYAQIFDGENPVADFTSSTALGPYLEAVGGRDSANGQKYEQKYRELIAEAYPKQSDGKTIFRMRRFFVVATKTGGKNP